MGEFIGLVAVIGIFGTPFVAVLAHHQRKLVEMKMRGGGSEGAVAQELAALRREVADLRDTTTKYDMSFDTALQRLESRVGHVEQRLSSVEAQSGSSQIVRS